MNEKPPSPSYKIQRTANDHTNAKRICYPTRYIDKFREDLREERGVPLLSAGFRGAMYLASALSPAIDIHSMKILGGFRLTSTITL